MIIAKVPYRVSLFGGGFDYLENIKNYQISTVGGSINKYIYVTCFSNPEDAKFKHKFSYRIIEELNDLNKIRHPLIKAVLNNFKKFNFNLSIKNEMAFSSGLGGSSSLCVALLLIKNFLKKKNQNPYFLYKKAVDIERIKIKEPGGVQDQAFACFNNFGKYDFYKNSLSFNLNFKPNSLKYINENSYLFYVNSGNKFRSIKGNQKKFDEKLYEEQHKITDEFMSLLNQNYVDEKDLSDIFQKNLNLKKKFHPKIYSKEIIDAFKLLELNGIKSYKLCGSGVSGYIYLITSERKAIKINRKYRINLHKINFSGKLNIFNA